MISTEGNTRGLHFSPAPMGPDFKQKFGSISYHSSDVLGISLFLYFRHPSLVLKKWPRWWKNTRPCYYCEERLDGDSVPQQQRAVSTAEEFCVQMHAIDCSLLQSPSKSNYHKCVRGNSKEIFQLFTNKLVYSVSVLQMKMMILTRTRHLLIIVYAPREKCIFTDYYERVFVFDFIYFVK